MFIFLCPFTSHVRGSGGSWCLEQMALQHVSLPERALAVLAISQVLMLLVLMFNIQFRFLLFELLYFCYVDPSTMDAT